jgi:sulfite exporter TauE/SafE
MTHELAVLTLTAAGIGFFHTLMGPDHYLPFIVLSRARGWSWRKTSAVTLLCGLGHVLSSVVLGLVGIGLGVAVGRLEAIEGLRGGLAAWALITVGLVYFAWGLHRALRRKGHHHFHFPGTERLHELQHHPERAAQMEAEGRVSLTPWVLFIIFALGPCEPLIPVLMYPAATASWGGAVLVAGVFSVVTMTTMLAAVWIGSAGLNLVPLGKLERYSHALAGAAIFLSGLGIQMLGL